MLIDSHCHLHLLKHDNLLHVLVAAQAAGIGSILNVATKWTENSIIQKVLQLQGYKVTLWGSVGIHPTSSKIEKHVEANDLIRYAKCHSNIRAFGESGLDFYKSYHPAEAIQIDMFKKHIYAAQETGLPLIIHTRYAQMLTIQILSQEFLAKPFQFIIHCFDGSQEFAEAILDLGGYISFSGLITYPKNTYLHDLIKAQVIPLSQVLIETDSPYLPPYPLGKKVTNYPHYLPHTMEVLSTLLQMESIVLIQIIYDNFQKLFSITTK